MINKMPPNLLHPDAEQQAIDAAANAMNAQPAPLSQADKLDDALRRLAVLETLWTPQVYALLQSASLAPRNKVW